MRLGTVRTQPELRGHPCSGLVSGALEDEQREIVGNGLPLGVVVERSEDHLGQPSVVEPA